MRLSAMAVGCWIVSAVLAWSMQSSTPNLREAVFAVASVKPNNSGSDRVSFGAVPGGYSATNVPLRFLVEFAFQVRRGHVLGGPDWVGSDRFDVSARAPEGTPFEALRQMMRALLEQRFRLAARIELRQQPIYALVQASKDGSLGPQVKPSTVVCAAPGAAANPCRINGTIGAVAGSVRGTGQTFAAFAAYLGFNVDRPVVDRTGLTGSYDFEFAWTADDLRAVAPDAAAAAAPNDRAILFTALQEQLGLKLEPTTGPVEFVVIDRVERPTPD